ncbi:uncharacterized protein LOC133198102 [Saccostrea echinata]|uniref:uncharacterized protein LOC133198102 n=1 Tax=Saccostrea echinata TaxID=191078 RepID=UPI002A817B95|nr:uncharacterized protein LOC133198102 [Saccostrea echinata]
MAFELKKQGFQHIVIFESRNEVGGKTASRFYRNVWHNLGAVGLTESYDKTVELLEKFNTGFEIRPEIPSYTWLNRKEFTSSLEAAQVSIPRLIQASERYSALYRCFFGTFKGEIMPRPSPEVLYRIRGTVDDFLLRYNLTDLQPLFFIALTLNGYGFLNETSAFYGLTFLPPVVINSFFKPERGAYRLIGGWQNLCRNIAERIDVEIRLNVDIKHIRRGKAVQIFYRNKNSLDVLMDKFDFLILTPSMNSLFGIMDFNQQELRIFKHLRHLYILKTIVNSISPGRRALSPLEIFPYDFQNVEYSVYRMINPHQAVNNVTGRDYQLGSRENTDKDGSVYETSVYLQLGKASPWNKYVDAHIQRKLFQHLRDFNKANPQVVQQVKWGYYFPNFPSEAITGGAVWDVLDMQGMYITWYIGASVSFDAIESVLEYNHLLLKLFFNKQPEF